MAIGQTLRDYSCEGSAGFAPASLFTPCYRGHLASVVRIGLIMVRRKPALRGRWPLARTIRLAYCGGMTLPISHGYARRFPAFAVAATPDSPPSPRLLLLNRPLADRLGLSLGDADEAELAQIFGGGPLPGDIEPVALAYAGHQFGQLNPRLGDGRAHLLGEIVAPDGARFDIQLKGSGATPFSRGGDGKAALGPVLREYLVSEAMAALSIPTSRALAAVLTGEGVWRERPLPGGVITRVAASHLRIGTAVYIAMNGGPDDVRDFARYVLERHYPGAADTDQPAEALLDSVMTSSARLVAAWLGVGFVHGVMNTDNIALSGETIDYGPCAFVDGYSAQAVFSSIDHGGRYAFGNQPRIMQWNLARLAEALLPAMTGDNDAKIAAANAAIAQFPARFERALVDVMAPKLGLTPAMDDGAAAAQLSLVNALFTAIEGQGADFTQLFRAIGYASGGDKACLTPFMTNVPALAPWVKDWHAAIDADGGVNDARMDAALAHSPVIIPRNHAVEAALADAVERGDMAAFHTLLAAVQDPFAERFEDDPLALPPPPDTPPVTTFCGT